MKRRERYILDEENFEVKERKILWPAVKTIIKLVCLSFASTIVCYGLLAIVYSTRTERGLKKEIRMYRKHYDELVAKEKLLVAEIEGLEYVNDEIYNTVFKTPAPNDRNLQRLKYSLNDTINADNLIKESGMKLEKMVQSSSTTEDNFRYIMRKLSRGNYVMPPMDLPLRNFSYARLGASEGEKLNPFYKVKVHHQGLDIFTEPGENVLATASGVVINVERSLSGLGNSVTIAHEGGYTTRYCHLAEISVSKGKQVKRGSRLGTTGVSGQSLTPCLHYEIRKDGKCCDPVHYFYYNLNPEEYGNCVIVSASTNQSLD